jgi:transcriptional regulator with XRE-family HTH domain
MGAAPVEEVDEEGGEVRTALRIARVAAGLSQRELARQIDRSQPWVHRAETGGEARVTPEDAARIAAALNVSPESIFTNIDEEKR